jgi:hypothetical protein
MKISSGVLSNIFSAMEIAHLVWVLLAAAVFGFVLAGALDHLR